MKKPCHWMSLLGASLLVLAIPMASYSQAEQPPGLARKIVVFQPHFVNQPAQEALLRAVGGVGIKPLPLINGWAVYLPAPAVRALLQRSEVRRVDDDLVVRAIGAQELTVGVEKAAGGRKPPEPQQTIPWGISQIDAPSAWYSSTGKDVKVAVLDTGIDLTHPDLKDNIAGGINVINPKKSYNDDNGHGTHVAGIIAAINNQIGVVGVAPRAKLYAVKVLGANGTGWLSDIIDGLGWCVRSGMQVINMSLGSSSSNTSFAEAIDAVYRAGIVQVAAAGNEGSSQVSYPAAYDQVIAVSATDSNDQLASFSNYGPQIDLAAPGVNILSTWKGGGYAYASGTSMAAPHVTGVVALRLAAHPNEGPDAVKTALQSTARDLGDPGWDQHYGAGLVDADGAVEY